MMESKGAQRVKPGLKTLQTLYNLTVADVTQQGTGSLGFLPIGNFKGTPAFFDLDRLVNQPTVLAEQQHILGILDGREEDYDLQTITVPITSVVATYVGTGTLTVPAGAVWYVNAIELTAPIDATAAFVLNWRSTSFADRGATPNAGGQLFTAAGHTAAVGVAVDAFDEFGTFGPLLAVTNKFPLLRLPSLTVLTFQVTITTAPNTLAAACAMLVYGFVGKSLLL